MGEFRPLTILIVEDEPLLAMDIGMMVEDAGHLVVGEAASLDEVEAMRQEIEPDLAFVDIQLAGGSSGLDVSALIRRRWTATIVVYVTANPRMVPADFAGGHGVIPKPFSRNGFMSAIVYLGQGILAPPPVASRPVDFIAADSLTKMWAPAQA